VGEYGCLLFVPIEGWHGVGVEVGVGKELFRVMQY